MPAGRTVDLAAGCPLCGQAGTTGLAASRNRPSTLGVVTTPGRTRDEQIAAQLRALPPQPGVYLFRGEDDDVLYVGKAKVLRSRVRSYFHGADGRQGIQQLVERIDRIEIIVTQSEAEALHLEQNLIKRHRPQFNVRLRDDKSYPYIAVTVADEFPRVMFTRERHRRGVVYFGPYASAKKVRETLDVLNRVFQFRPCEGPQPGRRSGIPCLDYHIERCLAPCVGHVTKEEYGRVIEGIVAFLSGQTDEIQRQLEVKMQEAAARQAFEEAARCRNRLFAVRHLAERQAADRRDTGTADVIGVAAGGNIAAVQVFPLRDGRLVDRHGFTLENVAGEDTTSLVEAFCLEYYGSSPAVPTLIVVPQEAGDLEALEEVLSQRRGSRVEVRVAKRGEKRRLQELAQRNAELALQSQELATERTRLRRIEALEELREVLNLESLPLRIECFDISQVQGAAPVGSMVVFQNAVAKKAHYRKFGVRDVEGQDDFAMMAEVISRRFARLGLDPGGRRLGRELRCVPESRRGRWREGPAVGRPRGDARVGCAPCGRDRIGQTRGGGLPARALRSGAPAARLGRPPAVAANPRRGAPLRPGLPPGASGRPGARVDPRFASRRGACAPAGSAAPLRLVRASARGGSRGARSGSGRASPHGPPDSCGAAQDGDTLGASAE